MVIQNQFTKHLQKRETALIWLISAVVYTALFSALEDPRQATISMVGRHHHVLFAFFCLVYGAAMLLNLNYMRRTYKVHAPFLVALIYGLNLFAGLIDTTLLPAKTGDGSITLFATIAHWIFGFGSFIVNATAALVFALLIYKQTKQKRLQAVVAVGSVICIADLLVFVGLTVVTRDVMKSKNGWFELIPVLTTFAVLYLANHTDLIRPRSERDADEKMLPVADASRFTACSHGMLAAAWLLFTTYAFVRSPIRFTISQIGLEYFGGYALTCILLAAAVLFNLLLMFKKHGYKNYFVIVLGVISSLSIILCVVQPTTMEKNISAVHAVSAILFFFGLLAVFLFYIIARSRQNKRYKPFVWLFVGVIVGMLTTMLLLFVVFDQRYGRTGLTELVPLEVMFAFLYLENFTNYFDAERNKTVQYTVEKQTVKKYPHHGKSCKK